MADKVKSYPLSVKPGHDIFDHVAGEHMVRIPSANPKYRDLFYIALENRDAVVTYMRADGTLGNLISTMQYHDIPFEEFKRRVKSGEDFNSPHGIYECRDESESIGTHLMRMLIEMEIVRMAPKPVFNPKTFKTPRKTSVTICNSEHPVVPYITGLKFSRTPEREVFYVELVDDKGIVVYFDTPAPSVGYFKGNKEDFKGAIEFITAMIPEEDRMLVDPDSKHIGNTVMNLLRSKKLV